ncbi:hypothetical protein bcgnr5372_27490 [Bacillus luti]|nr:hypothetical protein [Bacillus cereus]HDR8338415.1 hypothetical protein [Bacillus cereus]
MKNNTIKNMMDFYKKWSKEEGIDIPEDISVDLDLNPTIFKVNSNKLLTADLLKTFKIPHVECHSLTENRNFAIEEAIRFFREREGEIAIRGTKGMCGHNTYFPSNEEEIPNMIETLLNIPTLPLCSPRYRCEYEYGVFMVGNKVEMVIRKELNPITNMHNLSTGAKASVIDDPIKLQEIQEIAEKVSTVFQLGFARIDIMDTKEGLKVLELSIPNFKKFALQNEVSEAAGKELFLKAYQHYKKQ